MNNLPALLSSCLTSDAIERLTQQLCVHPSLQTGTQGRVTRAELAQALNMLLFEGLVTRVDVARDYLANDVAVSGRQVVFDHGALRTVKWACGSLPSGEAALTRILRPLGFRLGGTYPLTRLRMTGRAYCHQDLPEDIAQFFVSELHPEQFSETFQSAVTRVLETSRDPLSARDIADLEVLARDQWLPMRQALRLLPSLVGCFERQHGSIDEADYDTLLLESPEMAWIATEGNAFNHATDRVEDVEALARRQKLLGRPIKDTVEISSSGRVRQTAFRAPSVKRRFITAEGMVTRDVPGSFYEFISREFISRDHEPSTEAVHDATAPAPSQDNHDSQDKTRRLDLAFDAGNATGIFGMTAARP